MLVQALRVVDCNFSFIDRNAYFMTGVHYNGLQQYEQLKKMNSELEEKVRERTQQVEALLRQKDAFINQLGHDLKNPLGPIINLLPILEKEEKDPEKKKMFQVVLRNVDYMKNLVVKTIELARLNSMNIRLNFEKINLRKEIDYVIEKNKMLFLEKNVKIFNNVPRWLSVEADRLLFDELCNNLLNNAVKYSMEGGKVIIDAVEKNGEIIVSFKDEGIGMTPGQINYIFDEFYKADESRHDFDSSGLGLAISKRIIEKHGGRIWAESPGVGQGSTFYFTLKPAKN